MDPDATATCYFRAMDAGHLGEAHEALSNLTDWARSGGFMSPYANLALRHAREAHLKPVEVAIPGVGWATGHVVLKSIKEHTP